MIRNPNDIREGEKKIRMLLAGYPGIGKSTLALSAPKPLHIDADFGVDRVEPRYRAPYIQPATYQEILDDLTPENVRNFETLVFDTGGRLVTLIGLWAIHNNPRMGLSDGSLSLKGYGVVKREFNRLMDFCFYELKKNIIVVFHATEEKDGENTRLRIKVEGGAKNDVWEPMDLGGFVEMRGYERVIGFSNCERYFAKGTRGIHGILKIPTLTPDAPNDFLTRLFADYNAQASAEVRRDQAEKEKYEAAMNAGRDIIATVTSVETANAALEKFNAIEHALTSQRELFDLWNANAKKRGLFYDKVLKRYTVPPTRPARTRKKSAAPQEEVPAPQNVPQDASPVSQSAPQGGGEESAGQ